MITRLSQFIFCFALFYSSQSVAYNEAMCILIKQEMQQYSNNKTSQQYRKAARDFKRNCNKPKQVQTKPVAPKVVEQAPEPHALTPEQEQALLEQINAAEQAIKQSVNNTTSAQPNEQIDEQQIEITAPEPTNNAVNTTEQKPLTTQTQVQPIADKNTPKVEPKTEPKKDQPTVKAAPKPAPVLVPTPVTEPPSSLLLPSLLLLVVVLIGAMVVIRLRRAKQNKAEPPAAPPVKEPTAAVTKNSSTKTEQTVTQKGAAALSKKPTVKNNEPSKAPINKVEPATEQPADHETQLTAKAAPTPEPKKIAPEPNTAEFEAAAKNTLARIQNANGFAEPEVREFDPDAPSVKRTRKPQSSPAEKPKAAPIEEVKPQASTLVNEPPVSTNPTTEPKSSAHLHNSDKANEPEHATQNIEHDFKEPEIRTYDPDAPLKASKKDVTVSAAAKPNNEAPLDAPASKATEQQPTQSAPEPESSTKQADASNPFANLSLDESWDPNSDKKPVIEPKKKAPKSQALIEAEERAKNMKTKD